MYQRFEHTADLGLRIQAETPAAVFEEAACALFDVLVDDFPTAIQPLEQTAFSVEADSYENLLVDWLGELLFRFETEEKLFVRFDVRLEDRYRLIANAWGERFDHARHRQGDDVKAITYHQIRFEQQPDQSWLAEVILDL